MNIPDSLIEKIKKGNVVIFAGAGLSIRIQGYRDTRRGRGCKWQ